MILILSSGEKITVDNYFNETGSADALAEIRFADATVWGIETVKALVQRSTEQGDSLYGYQGVDRLDGQAGDDVLYGYAGDDNLMGGLGNDRLYGGSGDDWLSGGKGEDVLVGGAGNDRYDYFLGDGNDRIDNTGGRVEDEDVLVLNDITPNEVQARRVDNNLLLHLNNNQTITVQQYFNRAGAEDSAIKMIRFADGSGWDIAAVKQLVQQHTPQDEVLYGYQGADALSGGEGNDRLYGYEGDDYLKGDEGDDFLYGGAGEDILKGGQGADVLEGGEGNDVLEGDKGDDALFGGRGDDILRGGSGNDTYHFRIGDGMTRLLRNHCLAMKSIRCA
nr:calcium-binding protein [Rappaport israeli]